MKHPWNLNRALVVLGALLVLVAFAIVSIPAPEHMGMNVPLAAGALLGGLLIAFTAPAWAYLVAALLIGGFPLVVALVFAVGALEHPGGGYETAALFVLLMGALVAFIGGIWGFAQARSRTAPRVGAGMGAPQGAFAGLLIALLLGMILSNALATRDSVQFAKYPVSHVESPDQTRTLRAAAVAFAPSPLEIPVGTLVDVLLINDDPIFHTLSYRLDGDVHTTLMPVGSEQHVYLKFDTPRTIHFWCDPHSTETDDSEGGMYGDIVVK